jgi:phosphohistidine phosphatase
MAHGTTQIRACYLVRHAIAEPRGAAWPDDDVRPLSAEGIGRMQQVVAGLAALDVTIDQVVSSPLPRARQTADLLVKGLARRATGVRPSPVILLDELAPGAAADQTMRAVAAATEADSIALVGHEPDLGLLAAWLLGTDRPIPFKKGAVCHLAVRGWPARAGRGELLWFAPPRLLRRLGPS